MPDEAHPRQEVAAQNVSMRNQFDDVKRRTSCTNCIDRAFTRFFLHDEKAMYSQPTQNGRYPFVILWN